MAPAADSIGAYFRIVLGEGPKQLTSLYAAAKARGKQSAMELATQAVFQQSHCPVHFDDLVTSFADCAPTLFHHLSAGLFILEWFPWDNENNTA